MGQYYKPVNTKNNQWLCAHKYDNGLKLMEHAWTNNDFVMTVESLLAKGGQWHNQPIVWVGDYYDEAGETAFYRLVKESDEITPKTSKKKFRFLLNHSKLQFIDKNKVPEIKSGWRIHPLPLMTCLGNGRGGGDFRGEDDAGLIGNWADNVIEPTNKKPPEDYKEVYFDLVE